jgi:hypothetical protein
MKPIRSLVLLASLVLAPLAGAQTAALKADNPHLAPSGGTLALTATLTYEGAPGAIGWSVELPADWSLVSVAGQTPPQIAPEAGTRGTLEFAFTEAPAARAEFTIVVRYPANAPSFSAKPAVILRQDGQLSQLKPAPVAFIGDDTPRQRTRDSQN